jgi:predicted Zn-dependent protease
MKKIASEMTAFFALLAGLYFAIGWASDRLAASVPDEWERKIFGSRDKGVAAVTGPSESLKNGKLNAIFTRLIKDKSLRQLDYRLTILDDKDPNAFAYPGGAVAVTSGLISLVTGEIGLAMVFAHEIGHHFHRHALKRMGRGLVMTGVFGLMFGTDPGLIVGLGMKFAHSTYSHVQEFESDDFGMRLVNRTYGTTAGCLEFFEKIQQEASGGPSFQFLSLVESHPYTPDRISRLIELGLKIDHANYQRRKLVPKQPIPGVGKP